MVNHQAVVLVLLFICQFIVAQQQCANSANVVVNSNMQIQNPTPYNGITSYVSGTTCTWTLTSSTGFFTITPIVQNFRSGDYVSFSSNNCASQETIYFFSRTSSTAPGKGFVLNITHGIKCLQFYILAIFSAPAFAPILTVNDNYPFNSVSWTLPSNCIVRGGLPLLYNVQVAPLNGETMYRLETSDLAVALPDLKVGQSYTVTVTPKNMLGLGTPASATVTPVQKQQCSGSQVVASSRGTIENPAPLDYQTQYAANSDCSWVIQAPSNYYVAVTVEYLSISAGTTLMIYSSNTTNTLLSSYDSTYNVNKLPVTNYVPNTARTAFKSSSSLQVAYGFKLSFDMSMMDLSK